MYDPSLAFLKEPDIFEIIQNDADIASCIQRRNQNVVRPWRIVPSPHAASKHLSKASGEATKRLAAVCNEAFEFIDRFDAARVVLAEAFILGRRYAKLHWTEMRVSLDGLPEATWFLPIKIQDVDRRRFRWVPEWSEGTPSVKKRVRLDMFDTNDGQWKPLEGDDRRSYVEYIWRDTEDRLGHGRGALEALFFTHYFKTGTLKRLIEGVDRWANGFLIAKVDSLRGASTDLDNATLTTKTKELLQKMRSDHVAVVEKTDDIQVLEPTGRGLQVALDLVRYFNESAERYCNGSVRPAGHSVDGTGSKAAAKEEGETSEAFYQFAREDEDAVLDRDLLGAFLYFNEATIQAVGLGDAKRPKFTSEQIKRQDPKTRIEVLNSSKVPILTSEYYAAMEATPPGPDDEVVDPAAMQMEHEKELASMKKPEAGSDGPER